MNPAQMSAAYAQTQTQPQRYTDAELRRTQAQSGGQMGPQPGGQQWPPTGLMGSEMALQGGLEGGLSGLLQGLGMGRQDIQSALNRSMQSMRSGLASGNSAFGRGASALRNAQGGMDAIWQQGQGAGNQYFNQGISPIEGFIPAGQNAQNQMSAFTGGQGAEAQQQAYNDFVESPGQAWLRERGERAVTRNASATGGLGSGRVLQELQRQGQGLAAQDFQNHYGRLQGLSNQGLQAAGQAGQLRGQQGMMNANMAQGRANSKGNMAQALAGLYGNQAQFQGSMAQGMGGMQQAAGSQLGNMAFGAGQMAGNMAYNTGNNLAQGRTAAGNAIANNISGTSQGLSNLINQGGSGLGQIIGQGGGTLAQLLIGAGGANAGDAQGLAQLLSQIGLQGSGQFAGLPGMPGTQQTQGWLQGIGQAAGGIGTGMAAFGMSDARLKTNIRKVGKTSSGTNVYTWDWNEKGRKLAGDQPTVGVMAHENMHAAELGPDGYLMVDYSRIT